MAAQAIELVARDRPYHPVRDYIRSLEWDGKDRLATMLFTFRCSTDYVHSGGRLHDDDQCGRANPRSWLSGGHHAEQGLMKSTAIEALFHPWSTDEIEQLGTKDASMQVAGVLGREIGELSSRAALTGFGRPTVGVSSNDLVNASSSGPRIQMTI